MSPRKFTIYQKGTTRNIIMTDTDPTDDVEKIKKSLLDILGNDSIGILRTQDDMLIFRPSDISAIMISCRGEMGHPEEKHTITNEKIEKTDEVETEKEVVNPYNEQLVFEEGTT